jgi:3-deoxy-7-phosphoheptulonate synthase
MILHLQPQATAQDVQTLSAALKAIVVPQPEGQQPILVTPAALKEVPEAHRAMVAQAWPMDSDIQLASRKYRPETRTIRVGDVVIGGDSRNTVMMTGPCSVESEEQIRKAAELCVKLGVKVLRAGAFKPRTSPYSFQGLGLEGLKLLDKMRKEYGLLVITEVRDATHVEDVIEWCDLIQIGAKSMYDHGILRRCGKANKPVLLKRGFGTTLQEFVQASEFILSGGNENVILCERGIRTFETKTRFTLDLCGVAWLREYTNLPIVLDPSHAIGYRYGVPSLAKACAAMGIEGLLIETHHDPRIAMSDADQQLDHASFTALHGELKKVCEAVGYGLV